jgi:hypothetical protein
MGKISFHFAPKARPSHLKQLFQPMNPRNIRQVTFVLLIPTFLFSVVGYFTENSGSQMAGVITAFVFLIRAWVEATSPSSTDKHS